MRAAALWMLCLLLTATLTIVPAGSAVPTCKDQATASAGGLHLVAAGIRSQVWQETNHVPGLQKGSCLFDGTIVSGDAFVVQAVPQDLGVLGLCVITPALAQCF